MGSAVLDSASIIIEELLDLSSLVKRESCFTRGGSCVDSKVQYVILNATDLIEGLLKEREAMLTDIARMCYTCKYRYDVNARRGICIECTESERRHSKWEWRGLVKEGGDNV